MYLSDFYNSSYGQNTDVFNVLKSFLKNEYFSHNFGHKHHSETLQYSKESPGHWLRIVRKHTKSKCYSKSH